MPLKKDNTPKIILLVIAALMAIMGTMVLITPASIFPDPSWGLQVMRSMQMGGGFNLITGPSPEDISKNSSSFLTWWSPGQYLAPYFFKTVFGINTGQATSVTVILGNLSGIAGLYIFFKKAGFKKNVAAISLLFIVLQQAFWVPYAYYNGGEILLFAFEGWFLYGCVSIKQPGVKLLLFILFSGWVGFLCKSSFMWIYASGLLCLWIQLSANQTNLWGWIKKGIWIGIPAVTSLAVIYLLYLSKGENPSSVSGGFKLTFEAFAFPLSSPLLAGFSVDDLFNGLIFTGGAQSAVQAHTTIVLLITALLSVLLILLILRYVPNNEYRLLLVVFYGMSVLFFGYSFLKQAVISYEARHFRIISLLITPGIIYLLARAKLPYRAAFLLICLVTFLLICLVIGYKSYKFVINVPKANKHGAHGSTGISQQFIDQPSLNYILALDQQKTNVIFVFVSADIGLEIQHNRIITLNEYNEETEKNIVPYNGHAGPIYMILPSWYKSKEVAVMCRYFPGYKDFTPTALSKDYVLYTAQ